MTALVQRLELAAAKGCCHTLLPDDCRALIEALEKARQTNITQREYYEGVIADGGKRIASLESRTVKLPPRVDSSNVPFTAHTWNCCLDAVEKCLTAAGIQVIEGEG